MAPFIRFGVSGPPKNQPDIGTVLVRKTTGPDEVAIVDKNEQGSGTAAFYAYSLYVQEPGQPVHIIDPMIVNDGGP